MIGLIIGVVASFIALGFTQIASRTTLYTNTHLSKSLGQKVNVCPIHAIMVLS